MTVEDSAPTTLPLVDWPVVEDDDEDEDEEEYDARLGWRQW